MANLWPYQSQNPWTVTGGTLSDQARLWLNRLQVLVTTNGGGGGGGGVQLGGDLGGTNASPTVIGIEGRPVSATAPTNTQVLTWVAADNQWEPQTPAPGVTFVREVPAGAMNGANTAFTLSFAPGPAASLLLFLNGVEQFPGADYAFSGAAITYAVAPKAADWQLATYTR